MKKYKIVLLSGDGIGPEISEVSIKVLKRVSQKHNIDPDLVETHFALLKRTAKKDNVEIFRVTSGKRKTTSATELLHKALININRKNYIKNRLSCKGCEFYKSKLCP